MTKVVSTGASSRVHILRRYGVVEHALQPFSATFQALMATLQLRT